MSAPDVSCVMDTNTDTVPMLSKWHLTDSCKRAMERATEKKREALRKLQEQTAAKRAQMQADADNWEPVQ